MMNTQLTFSEYFNVQPESLESHGALDLCVEADLPLFIDPFLLFASDKPEYKTLHQKIVAHLIHLKEVAVNNPNEDLGLFQFHEVKQNWLGFSKWGNGGKGLGPVFAKNLTKAFKGFYSNFGNETISKSSHIEKLTIVGSGIGRDFISDFTTNLMLEYLLEYTQAYALNNLSSNQRKKFSVRCEYDYKLNILKPKTYELPYFYKGDNKQDYIILTPIDILTKDDAFISHSDFIGRFRLITSALPNSSLRESINLYFSSALPVKPKKDDIEYAIMRTVEKYPEIIDYYIKHKEDNQSNAAAISKEKVEELKTELLAPLVKLCKLIFEHSKFYDIIPTSYDSALIRAHYLKICIEENDVYKIFYHKGVPIASEDTIQKLFRLTWFASPLDVNSEVNNGRGPADYKISYGNKDSTIVEFKLGRSTSIKKNLLNQTEIYKKASKSTSDIKVILCYTKAEIAKVQRILKSIGQESADNIIIIDASKKDSASKV